MIYFIGQAPSKSSKDNRGWAPGGASNALAKLAGISYDDLTAQAQFLNLLPLYPGVKGSSDAFDLDEATREAATMKTRFADGDVVVCLGEKVARAFGGDYQHINWLESRRIGGVEVWLMPHPSGRNRWYNDAENKQRARQFIKRLLSLETS